MVDFAPHLSATAQARFHAGLPGLLRVVRRRRRWRAAKRVAVAVGVVAAAIAVVWSRAASPSSLPGPGPSPHSPAAPFCTVVHDDATVLARCTVGSETRAAWFIDDVGLRTLLQEDARPDGLIRIDGRVLVDAAAIDPFPSTAP